MAESILDRLDREHGDARQYIANLTVVGGATRAQVAAALAAKYGIKAPTTRSIIKWLNHDPELRGLVRSMESAKLDVTDDPTALLPRGMPPAQNDLDLFNLMEEVPAFGVLMARGGDEGRGSGDVGLAFAPEHSPAVADDEEGEIDDARAVLLAEHETPEEFAADCYARLTDEEKADIAHLLPAA